MIYKVEFAADYCGTPIYEIEADVKEFNEKYAIYLNEKVVFIQEEDRYYCTCKTEKRLLPELIKIICERYNLEYLETRKWF